MGNYDNIQIPIQGQPISTSQYGNRVRDAILSLDARVASIESTLSNYVTKVSNTTRTATTTNTDDPDLKLYLEAGSKYFVEFFITVGATAAEDFKTSWSLPTGALTFNRRVLGPGSAALDAQADNIAVRMGTHGFATPITYNGVRNSTNQFQVQEIGIITTGPANPGYVGFQWAQGTSGATGTIVYGESFGRATKVG
jgi:hypothetical protein